MSTVKDLSAKFVKWKIGNIRIDRKFDWSILIDSLKSIHKNHNIALDNKSHSLIAKTYFSTMSNNVLSLVRFSCT